MLMQEQLYSCLDTDTDVGPLQIVVEDPADQQVPDDVTDAAAPSGQVPDHEPLLMDAAAIAASTSAAELPALPAADPDVPPVSRPAVGKNFHYYHSFLELQDSVSSNFC